MSNQRFTSQHRPTPKISTESADAQVVQLLDHYGIYVEDMEADQADVLRPVLAKLSRYYANGFLENIEDKGSLLVIQHLQKAPGDKKDITYGELQGKHRVGHESRSGDNMARLYSMMSALAGLTTESLKALYGIDLAVMEALSVIFFAL